MKTVQEHFGLTEVEKEQIIETVARGYSRQANINSVSLVRTAITKAWGMDYQSDDTIKLTLSITLTTSDIVNILEVHRRNCGCH